MPQIITGSGGVNRKAKQLAVGVGGANRKVKEAWAGVAGVDRKVFASVDPNLKISLYSARRSGKPGVWTGIAGWARDKITENPRNIDLYMNGRRYVDDTSSHMADINSRARTYCSLSNCHSGDQVSFRTNNALGCGSYRDVFIRSTIDRGQNSVILYQSSADYTTERVLTVTAPQDGFVECGIASGWAKEKHSLSLKIFEITVNGITVYPISGQAEIPADYT